MNTRRFNWGMVTEPEPGLQGRRINLPRGKGMGGSSSINGMCYVRGNPMDYELWSAKGATGWHWANVLPYFQKMERVADDVIVLGFNLFVNERAQFVACKYLDFLPLHGERRALD